MWPYIITDCAKRELELKRTMTFFEEPNNYNITGRMSTSCTINSYQEIENGAAAASHLV